MAVATLPGPQELLQRTFTPALVREHLLPRADWRPFPRARDRAAWEALPTRARERVMAAAEPHLGTAWPALPATLFLEFRREGNRSRYEERHFARRNALMRLVTAECVEGRGRFLDDIVNGAWVLCEESFWGVPAHSFSPRFGDRSLRGRYPSAGLPDTDYPVVDLFAAETGALLAWTHYLVGDAIARELPVLTDRIEREVQARILRPFREIDDWWWLRNHPDHPTNNWNPWILSNVLAMNLLLEPDAALREATTLRAIAGLDAFLAVYHADGGCDEGTSYWGRAGASLFDCLDLLSSASGGGLDGFTLPLVQEIGRYIYRMHIGRDWYVNFADGSAKVALESNLVYQFGKRIGDPRLMAQGASARETAPRNAMRVASMARDLSSLLNDEELAAAAGAPPLIREAWLAGTEVLTAREREGTTEGLFLAAKGGHNAESHNHNDVGNLIVALDGHPVLIDVGVETYSRKTFSADRYDIWTMPSGYHNVPLIDGHQQRAGREFAARDVAGEVAEDHAQLSLDLAAAYPIEAGIRHWRRAVRLERGEPGRIVLREAYTLERQPQSLALHLMASGEVEASQEGTLRCAGPTRPLVVRYDPAVFSATVEPIAVEDARLKPVWGDRVYRVVLTARSPRAAGEWTLTMTAG